MAKHWYEVLACSCGKRFRSAIAEARHRHNFPALCRLPNTIHMHTIAGPKNVGCCGAYTSDTRALTTNVEHVTCGNCKRTHEFNQAKERAHND